MSDFVHQLQPAADWLMHQTESVHAKSFVWGVVFLIMLQGGVVVIAVA